MLQCPGKGIKGHKVYLRDDRNESDQLKLCEVEAFGYRDDEGEIQSLDLDVYYVLRRQYCEFKRSLSRPGCSLPADFDSQRGGRGERDAGREGEGRVPVQRPLRALGWLARGAVRRENGRKVNLGRVYAAAD